MNVHAIVALKSLQISRAHFMNCCDLEVVVVSDRSMSKGLMISTSVFPYKGESTLQSSVKA